MHPISLHMDESRLERARGSSFFRPILAIPHIVWTYLWGIAAAVAWLLGWLVGIFTGSVPGFLHGIIAGYLKYLTRATAYITLMTDSFPSFGSGGEYPITLTVPDPVKQTRMSILFRPVLAFPALLLSSAITAGVGVGAILFWVRILFVGNVTPGIMRLMRYGLRYQAQLNGYLMLTTDAYPDSDPLADATA